MPPKKKPKSWNWVLILIFFTLLAGILYVQNFHRWIQDQLTAYPEDDASWTEALKLERAFNRFDDGILGIDISEYQGKINYPGLQLQLQNHQIEFMVIRATMGDDGLDSRYKENWESIQTLPLTRGVYHYYRPNENSAKQAQNFIKTVKLQSGDLIPVLDIEKHSTIQSREKLREGIKNWLRIVEEHYGVKPMIYTGDRFFWEVLHDHGFDEYPIWVANYNRIKEPETENWVIWQFTEKGELPGIKEKVDLNLLRGGKFLLHKLRIP